MRAWRKEREFYSRPAVGVGITIWVDPVHCFAYVLEHLNRVFRRSLMGGTGREGKRRGGDGGGNKGLCQKYPRYILG